MKPRPSYLSCCSVLAWARKSSSPKQENRSPAWCPLRRRHDHALLAVHRGRFGSPRISMRPFQKRYSKPLNHESAVGYSHVHSRPAHHRDPFDRMLVAQSQIEKIPIVTGDGLIARYDVTVKSGEKPTAMETQLSFLAPLVRSGVGRRRGRLPHQLDCAAWSPP